MSSEPKKVGQVLRRFVPEAWGGIESAVYHLCQELQERRIESPIYCTDALSAAGRERYQGLEVRRFRHCFPWLFLNEATRRQLALKGGNPLSFSLLYALLREPGLSLIHTHVQNRLGGIARTAARLRGIPYVVTLHGGYFTLTEEQSSRMTAPVAGKWEWGKAFGWLLGSRRTLQDAAAILCVGQDEYAHACAQFPHARVRYIPNGVDCEAFRVAEGQLFRQALGFSQKQKLILCVSRIDPQKDQLLLVRAFAQFLREFPDYRLVLLGPISVESYHREIVATIAELGIEQSFHIIPGYGPRDPLLASAYKAADLFVLPSVVEPFGIVVLEAWAAGVPVVASAVGGIPGFVRDGETALFFPSGDQGALVDRMRRLASDQQLRRQLVAQGTREVEAYHWSRITDQILQVYQEVLA